MEPELMQGQFNADSKALGGQQYPKWKRVTSHRVDQALHLLRPQ
jgi:hypothetical protein